MKIFIAKIFKNGPIWSYCSDKMFALLAIFRISNPKIIFCPGFERYEMNIWSTFVRKLIIAKTFQKYPNLITLLRENLKAGKYILSRPYTALEETIRSRSSRRPPRRRRRQSRRRRILQAMILRSVTFGECISSVKRTV